MSGVGIQNSVAFSSVQTRNAASSYSAQCWIEGIAGFTDADPNVTGLTALLAANRIINIRPDIICMGHTQSVFVGEAQIVAALADGTSASVKFWIYDDTKTIFYPMSRTGGAIALTYAGHNEYAPSIGARPGAKYFSQVTANSGVTKIAFFTR